MQYFWEEGERWTAESPTQTKHFTMYGLPKLKLASPRKLAFFHLISSLMLKETNTNTGAFIDKSLQWNDWSLLLVSGWNIQRTVNAYYSVVKLLHYVNAFWVETPFSSYKWKNIYQKDIVYNERACHPSIIQQPCLMNDKVFWAPNHL